MLAPSPQNIIDPFYPDGYASSDQDRAQIAAQKAKYAPSVGSVNFKFPFSISMTSIFTNVLFIGFKS